MESQSPKTSKYQLDSEHRFCVAPMMDWTDRHCRYFLRLITRHARLYTEMITAPALVHGDVPHHLDFDPAEHPLALQLGGSDPARARARGEARRALGLRRDQPQLRLPVRARADRQLRRVPDGRAGARRRLRARDARRRLVAGHRQAPHRPRRGDDYGFVRDFVGTVADAGCDVFIVHARNAVLKGLVAEGEPRGAAAALRRRARAEARLPARSRSC